MTSSPYGPPHATPSTEELRARIDRGETREKVAAVDSAAAQPGADAEAAGAPPSASAVNSALASETRGPHRFEEPGLPAGRAGSARLAVPLLIGGTVVLVLALVWLL